LSIVDLVLYLRQLITQGISTTVVLVRVEMGVSYDHNTSRTALSTNPGRPIKLTQFTSKLNQTTESDDPNDTRSERKLIRPN
jgi:hypothetical protein